MVVARTASKMSLLFGVKYLFNSSRTNSTVLTVVVLTVVVLTVLTVVVYKY